VTQVVDPKAMSITKLAVIADITKFRPAVEYYLLITGARE